MTGSRLGSRTSPLQIVVSGVGTIDGSEYYNPEYWEPGPRAAGPLRVNASIMRPRHCLARMHEDTA